MSAEITEASMDRFSSMTAAKHKRHIPMGASHNLRTLEGIRTMDGRVIASDKLYRSDSIASLQSGDLRRLSDLQLRVVTDFRSQLEQMNAPHGWAMDQVEIIHRPIPVMGDNGRAELVRVLQEVGCAEDMSDWLSDLYRSMVSDFSDVYASWLHSLLHEDSYPQLYHCTAGKDRTGVATALLLKLLGVADELIMDDFLLSNTLSADYIEARITGRVRFSWMTDDVDSENLRPLLSVQREFLEATFRQIDEAYGDFGQYARQCLGIKLVDIRQLETILLNDS